MLHMSDKAMQLQQQETMRQQDMMILQIEEGVGRMHTKALAIGDETKLQNKLLESMDEHIDSTAESLKAEAKHAQQVRDTGKVTYMYICIAVEVLVLVVLVAIMFIKK
jgi:hypothetical protein